MMQSIFKNVSPQFFIQKFLNFNNSANQKTIINLPTSIILSGFKYIWIRLSFQQRFQRLVLLLAQNSQMKNYKQLLKNIKYGWKPQMQCGNNSSLYGCHKNILIQDPRQAKNLIAYQQCKHIYHIQCHYYQNCQICMTHINFKIQQMVSKLISQNQQQSKKNKEIIRNSDQYSPVFRSNQKIDLSESYSIKLNVDKQNPNWERNQSEKAARLQEYEEQLKKDEKKLYEWSQILIKRSKQ